MRPSLLTMLALLLSAPAAAQPAAAFAGPWEGLLRIPGEFTPFSLALTEDGGHWSGTIDVPSRSLVALPLASVEVEGDSVRIRLPEDLAVLRARYDPKPPALYGTARVGRGEATFTLVRPGTIHVLTLAQELADATPFEPHAHPDSARLVTEDLPRFWAAYDGSTPETRAAAFHERYLLPGTVGLQDFLFRRIGSAENLAAAAEAHPRYLASARASMARIPEFEPQIRAAFHRLEALYPEAVYPDVYFLVGRFSTGGTTSPRGLLIGAEMYGRTPALPEDELPGWLRAVLSPVETIPAIVAHELIHYQQRYPADTTLLRQALNEGIADYLGEVIAGAHINAALHAYGDAHEAALFCEFRQAMRRADTSRWLYNGNASPDRPGDLGYYVGYKIAAAYAARALTSGRGMQDVVRALLTVPDFAAFLDESGYPARFTCQQ